MTLWFHFLKAGILAVKLSVYTRFWQSFVGMSSSNKTTRPLLLERQNTRYQWCRVSGKPPVASRFSLKSFQRLPFMLYILCFVFTLGQHKKPPFANLTCYVNDGTTLLSRTFLSSASFSFYKGSLLIDYLSAAFISSINKRLDVAMPVPV